MSFWDMRTTQQAVPVVADANSEDRPPKRAKTGVTSNGQASSNIVQAWPPLTGRNGVSLPLTLAEYERYGRQMILGSFGLEGQRRLRQAKVLVVGAGGLGCPAVQYLAAAGVGNITVVDNDVVERSNLARQILHTEQRIGLAKAKSIQEAVRE